MMKCVCASQTSLLYQNGGVMDCDQYKAAFYGTDFYSITFCLHLRLIDFHVYFALACECMFVSSDF